MTATAIPRESSFPCTAGFAPLSTGRKSGEGINFYFRFPAKC